MIRLSSMYPTVSQHFLFKHDRRHIEDKTFFKQQRNKNIARVKGFHLGRRNSSFSKLFTVTKNKTCVRVLL